MTGNALIIGGTGFLGHHLTKKLSESDLSCTVLSRVEPKAFRKVVGVNYIQADLAKQQEVNAAIEGSSYKYVINLGGYVDHSPFMSGGMKVVETHFFGLCHILNAINTSKIQCFLNVGSSNEYGMAKSPIGEDIDLSPTTPYAFSKVASSQLLEMLAKTEDFPSVNVRLFLAYGPGQLTNRLIPQLVTSCLKKEPIVISSPNLIRDFCFITDVIEGIYACLISRDCIGHSINIASGIPVSIKRLAEMVIEICGSGSLDIDMDLVRPNENKELFANIAKAKNLVGWAPEVCLKAGLEQVIQSMKGELDAS